jgi:hypothetical protein
MREKIILEMSGGLGDCLLHSTLPERYVKERNSEVYIMAGFTNNEIKKIVWESNPFVSGFIPLDRPVMGCGANDENTIKFSNNIKGAEFMHGFEPKNEYPKLYNMNYKHNYDLQDKHIIDLTSNTIKYSEENIKNYFNKLLNYKIIEINKCLIISNNLPNKFDYNKYELFKNIPKFHINDIFEYANAIFSCKTFVCVQSGSSALASAIKGQFGFPKITSIIKINEFNNKNFSFAGIDFFVTE